MKQSFMHRTIVCSIFFLINIGISSFGLSKEKLFIPKNAKEGMPLFVALHGCLATADDSESTTRMSEFGEKNGFFVFYPEPELEFKDSKGCFNFYSEESQRPGGGDAAMIVQKIQNLVKNYNLDPQRVYVVGMSGGASLISVLLSCYPNVFAGGAIHSGMSYGLAQNWQESLFIAQFGPIPHREPNRVCNPTDFHGKLFLAQGSRDQVMNPRHFSQLKKDFIPQAKVTSRSIAGSTSQYGYKLHSFYENNQLRGKGLFVIGMNHEWSGSGPISVIGPKGPDVSKMIVDYFLNEP